MPHRDLRSPAKFLGGHMPSRFRNQQPATRTQRAGHARQRTADVRHFVEHRERQCEIHSSRKIIDPQRRTRANTRLNSSQQSRLSRPALDDRIIFSCRSIAITFPCPPTSRASGKVKYPIALPTSRTSIPACTCGFRISSGLWKTRRNGLASKYPSHHGQTCSLMTGQPDACRIAHMHRALRCVTTQGFITAPKFFRPFKAILSGSSNLIWRR